MRTIVDGKAKEHRWTAAAHGGKSVSPTDAASTADDSYRAPDFIRRSLLGASVTEESAAVDRLRRDSLRSRGGKDPRPWHPPDISRLAASESAPRVQQRML